MSGYDLFVASLSRSAIEAKAWAWRIALGIDGAWVPDLPRILEMQLPALLPRFALRILPRDAMPDEEARTWHSVPAIDIREDAYNRLCDGNGRDRFTAAHELGHLFLHSGESRPRAVMPIKPASIPADRSSERQANAFASSFLMPESIVRQFGTPADLAAGCQVSPSAAEHRMRELLLWPKGRPLPPEVTAFLESQKKKKR